MAVTTLLVASTGGHLKQLHHLYRRLTTISGPYVWATFDTPQSRSLLEGEEVEFVPFVGGRDLANVARNLRHARRILKQHRVDTMVSTGSAVALPFFALGRTWRLRCHYIESAARREGPSLTGKLISRVPGVHLYCQWPAWAERRWRFRGSVFDAFTGVEREGVSEEVQIRRAVVTLGTYKDFGFPLLVERLLELLPLEADVLWQTGDTDVSRYPIAANRAIPEKELTAAMAEADVVIAHAGVGASLAAFDVGKYPLLVPRRRFRNEHIDDHQIQIAAELSARGVAVTTEADALVFADIQRAAKRQVLRLSDPPPFETDA